MYYPAMLFLSFHQGGICRGDRGMPPNWQQVQFNLHFYIYPPLLFNTKITLPSILYPPLMPSPLCAAKSLLL